MYIMEFHCIVLNKLTTCKCERSSWLKKVKENHLNFPILAFYFPNYFEDIECLFSVRHKT